MTHPTLDLSGFGESPEAMAWRNTQHQAATDDAHTFVQKLLAQRQAMQQAASQNATQNPLPPVQIPNDSGFFGRFVKNFMSLLYPGSSGPSSGAYAASHGPQAETAGALQAYGLDPSKMDQASMPAQLAAQRQQYAEGSQASGIDNVMGQMAGIPVGVALGAVEAPAELVNYTLRLLSKTGPEGEAVASFLDKIVQTQATQENFARLNENVRKSLPAGAQYAFNELPWLNPVSVGKFVGMTPLNAASYGLAGAVMENTGLTAALGEHTIMRAGAQGALAGLGLTVTESMPWLVPATDPNASPTEKAGAFITGTRAGQSLFGGVLGSMFGRIFEHAANSPDLAAPAPKTDITTPTLQRQPPSMPGATVVEQSSGAPGGQFGMFDRGAQLPLFKPGEFTPQTEAPPAQPGYQQGDLFAPRQGDFFNGYDEPAAATLGAQLTKQAQVMQSPALSEVVGSTDGLQRPFNSVDIVHATYATNPAGQTVIPNVTDIADVLAAQHNGELGYAGIQPASVQLVERNGQYHFITSTTQPLDETAISDYQNHGVFAGMKIQSLTGGVAKDGTVVRVQPAEGKTYIWWSRDYAGPNGPVQRVHRSLLQNVQPSTVAPAIEAAPLEWGEFEGYAANRLDALATYEQSEPIHPLSERGRIEMPRLVNDFLDEKGIVEPVQRHAVLNYFDKALVNDYRLASGAEPLATQTAMEAQVARETAEASEHSVPTQLMDRAAGRGFDAVRTPDGATSLQDRLSGAAFHFDGEPAAERFLNTYHRDLPTIDLPTVVPLEVAHELPAIRVSDSRPPEDIAHADLWLDELNARVDEDQLTRELTPAPAETEPLAPGPPPPSSPTGFAPWPPMEPPPTMPPTPPKPPAGTPPGDGVPEMPRIPGVVRHRGDIEARVQNLLARTVQPLRSTMAKTEAYLDELGLHDVRPHQAYWNLTYARSDAHRASYEPSRQIASEFNHIGGFGHIGGSLPIRDGAVWRILGTPEDGRLAQVHAENTRYAEERITSDDLEHINNLDRSMAHWLAGPDLPEVGTARWEEVKRFVSETQLRQITETEPAFGKPEDYPQIPWFVEHAEESNMQFKSPDASDIMHSVIKTYNFDRFAKPAWDEAVALSRRMATMRFEGDAGSPVLAPVSQYMDQWLKAIRLGHSDGSDYALDFVHTMMNKVVPTTRREASDIINGILSTIHRSVMGWQAAPIIRDATQPWMALPYVGVDHLTSTYGDMVSGGKAAIFERAVHLGTIEKGIPPIEGSGLTHDLRAPEGSLPSSGSVGIRKLLASTRDFVRDVTPPELRTISGTKWDPMAAYTRNGEYNRVIVGEAAWRKFNTEHADFQQAVKSAIRAGTDVPTLEGFVKDIGNGLEKPVQRMMLEQLQQGSPEEAARTFAREVTDMTQFRYGIAEQGPALRTHTARMGLQFGNFTIQSVNYLGRTLRNGDAFQNAKVLGWVGLTTAAAAYAEAKTGWSFSKWIWVDPRYRGGPMTSGFDRMRDFIAAVSGQDNTENRNVIRDFIHEAPADMAQYLNPFDAVRKTAGAMIEVNQSPNPVEALGRFIVTGGRGGSTFDYRQQFNDESLLNNDESQAPLNHNAMWPGAPKMLPAPGGGPNPLLQHMQQTGKGAMQ